MRLLAPCPELETAVAAVTAARPSIAGDGVDVTGLIQGGRFKHAYIAGYVLTDGSADTLDSPTGGAKGPEVWTYKANKAGTKKWFLIDSIHRDLAVPITATGGFSFLIESALVGDKLHICGTGAHAQTYWFAPVEDQRDAR